MNEQDRALDRWIELRKQGLTALDASKAVKQEFPHLYGRNKLTGVKRTLFERAAEAGIKVPRAHKEFTERAPELIFEYIPRLIVFSDPHFPLHDEDGIAKVVQTIRARGYETMVWCGDSLDQGHKGHKGIRKVYVPRYKDGLAAMAKAHDLFTEAGIRRSILIRGNHDSKIMYGTDNEITWDAYWKTQVWPLLEHKTQHWDIAERFYAIMRPANEQSSWPLTPDNFATRFTHQKNYSAIPLSVARSIATTKLQHVVTGHQHHLSIGMHASNLLFVADAGTCQDFRLAGYKGIRDTRHPEWTPGFLTIEYGTPETWAFGNSDEWWEKKWEHGEGGS